MIPGAAAVAGAHFLALVTVEGDLDVVTDAGAEVLIERTRRGAGIVPKLLEAPIDLQEAKAIPSGRLGTDIEML